MEILPRCYSLQTNETKKKKEKQKSEKQKPEKKEFNTYYKGDV